MIQTVMLVTLGFLAAMLISLLLAPVVWRRAAYLAEEKLKSNLPVSMTDFHAEKDQLRADHAMAMRGLELKLEGTKEKTAQQMVEIGRQQAENMSLTTQIRDLRAALSERKSLIAVMEQTLNTNVPRMKQRLESEIGARIELSDTVQMLEGSLKKTSTRLQEADQGVKLREAEILKLRQAVNAAPRGGSTFMSLRSRKKQQQDLSALDLAEGGKGAKVLEELQSENRKLHEVIEQTRAQLAQAHAFEAREIPLLRQEMRQLGTEVLRSAEVPKIDQSTVKKAKPNLPLGGSKPEVQKVKLSLAERLKSVTKMGGQVDA